MIQVSSILASGFGRSRVCWIMERSPSRANTCLARARRERGQKRVPLPPARITGRKSIGFDIEDTSYWTGTTFAQCSRYFLPAEIGGSAESPRLAAISSSHIARSEERRGGKEGRTRWA